MVAAGAAWLRADTSSGTWSLAVRDLEGRGLHAVALPDSAFSLRYRNSIYGSLAEERFEVTDDGRIRLRELAAEDPAVLTEYYRLDGEPMRSQGGPEDLAWTGVPEQATTVDELEVAATELGERTLLVRGTDAVALWQLVDRGEPGVVLSVEREP